MESVYDRALMNIGNNGKFQRKHDIIYNIGLVFFWSMAYANIILCLTIVPHTCRIPDELSGNISEYAWKQTHLPTYIAVSGETRFNSCAIYVDSTFKNATKKCTEYSYDKSWYEWTASSENDWVCDKELYIANILGISKIGESVGSIIFGWLGDVKVIESPRWLHTSGKNKECIKILRTIAKVNKRELNHDVESELWTTVPVNSQKVSPLVLFAGTRLALNTILQIILWTAVTLNYTVLVLRSGEKTDGNPFLEFAWQCVVEVPSNFIGAWLSNNIGRRGTSSLSNGTTGVMWIVILLRETNTVYWFQHWLIGSVAVIIGRLTIFVSYYALSLFCVELYPTCLRQSGMAAGNIVSSCASALAPYILYLGRKYDGRLPGITLIIASIISVIVSLILPETLNVKLPETIEEAQNFGKKAKYTDIKLNDTT